MCSLSWTVAACVCPTPASRTDAEDNDDRLVVGSSKRSDTQSRHSDCSNLLRVSVIQGARLVPRAYPCARELGCHNKRQAS